jgi:hypothetical protein
LRATSRQYTPHRSVLPSLTSHSGRKLVPVDFSTSVLVFGGLKAHDFFGDGSLYLLDVPGVRAASTVEHDSDLVPQHIAGHVCALARVTPDSFIFLGGDSCHHAGLLRPTSQLHKHFPCPGALLAATRSSVSVTHFSPSDATGSFDLAARTTPLLDVAEGGFFEDPPTARLSLNKVHSFDANEDVFVVLAHDESLMPVVGPFPTLLDGWKAKGWKKLVTLAFLDEKNPAFRFNAKAV